MVLVITVCSVPLVAVVGGSLAQHPQLTEKGLWLTFYDWLCLPACLHIIFYQDYTRTCPTSPLLWIIDSFITGRCLWVAEYNTRLRCRR